MPNDCTTYILFNYSNTINPNLLNLFALLPTVLSSNLSLIFISESPLNINDVYITIYIPNYSKPEIITYLSDFVTGDDQEFINIYINTILDSFYGEITDLSELSYITNYLLTYIKNESDDIKHNKSKLLIFLKPYIIELKKHLFIHDVTQESLMENNTDKIKSDLWLNLPLLPKLILISGFLCSYNPPSQDQRFFSISSSKKIKRRANTKHKKDEFYYYAKGPRSFPLERLLAIFHSLSMSYIFNIFLVQLIILNQKIAYQLNFIVLYIIIYL